ncbi:hypothetical protein KL953_08640 [Mycolicibacterium goodii]|uniref:hypothetical protein n=1 Tax=Mycolicibacterium goodii TaxID=134601 RepID=UPI001BDD0F21|nr:hypothetical protein [Mycolicibacterium goodii]MBU8808962.1 hypothetical protein [Mycolicibacterium goodii]
MNARAIKPGTIVVDVSFASRYGVADATKHRVVRLLEGNRLEATHDEYGETVTEILHVDEVAPLINYMSTYDLILEVLARGVISDASLLEAAGVSNIDQLIAWAQRRDSGQA